MSEKGGVPARFATVPWALKAFFAKADNPIPLWVAEPTVELAQPIDDAIRSRADSGWYGYESRIPEYDRVFKQWMSERHGWDLSELKILQSPSIGTSIASLLDIFTADGDGVILQTPVFTDFKPLVSRSERAVIKNSLILKDGRYEMDFSGLEEAASDPKVKALILCNPHNPVGRVWTKAELANVAQICERHNVLVISDEIHCDLMLNGATFSPFADAASGTSVRWAALHGPIKTFGVAGICDTLLITDDEEIADCFGKRCDAMSLNRNNIFGLAAFHAGYSEGGEWLDEFIHKIEQNVDYIRENLPDGIELIEPESTYLAWLDFSGLGMDVPELTSWLSSEVNIAVSPGHWFGREGAGFARMTIAVEREVLVDAIERMRNAVERLSK